MESTKETEALYTAQTYRRFDLTLAKGLGSTVEDDAGKSYIDLGAGIAVNSFGIADPVWRDAVIAQLSDLQHASNLYYTKPFALLAKALAEKSGLKRFFFSNSGAEANECAIKAARKYSRDKYGNDRYTIVSLDGSFHGRTLATLAATGNPGYQEPFQPMPQGFVQTPPNDIEAMAKALESGGVAAVMMEMIQGEGGVRVLDREFVQASAAMAREKDILLVVDEVQTGNGRTGRYFSYEHYGIEPDIVTTAKGLAGGLPLGVTGFSGKTQDVLTFGNHGSTFGGNPVACAGALSIIGRIDADLMAQVSEKGEWMMQALKGQPGVAEVTGMGLMVGILPDGPTASEVVQALMEKGVLVLTASDRIRLLPALNIPFGLLKEAVGILVAELARLHRQAQGQ